MPAVNTNLLAQVKPILAIRLVLVDRGITQRAYYPATQNTRISMLNLVTHVIEAMAKKS